MQTQAVERGPDAVGFLEPVPRSIEKATDLGNVQVLKHGDMYLLTDQFGDIHADGRGLGLYDGDTRRLSSLILGIGGQRPVLLQASVGSNFRGSIQLTNPRMERDMRDKVRPEEALASQKLGITRHRLLGVTGFEERLQIVNFSEHDEVVEVELELAADAADIFEVRGWTRSARGSYPAIGLRPGRVTFRYDGLDGVRRYTHVAFSSPARSIEPVDGRVAGLPDRGWIRLAWPWSLTQGDDRERAGAVWP